MKKQIFLTSAMAATLSSLSGCSSGDDWDGSTYAENDLGVCVDQNGYRVDDDWCDDDNFRRSSGYGWFYVSRGSRVPYYGDSIKDKKYGFVGSAKPDPSKVYGRAPESTRVTRSTAMARGGFGSSSRSFGGGRS
jgi:hypothetical protein